MQYKEINQTCTSQAGLLLSEVSWLLFFIFYNTSSIEMEQVFNSGRNCVFVFTATTLSASSAPATEKCPEASHSSTSMRWYVHTHTSTSTCISTCTVSCSPYLYHNLTLIPNITLKPSPLKKWDKITSFSKNVLANALVGPCGGDSWCRSTEHEVKKFEL